MGKNIQIFHDNNFFFHLLFLIKAQLQDRYKQYDIINYANLITNTNYKIITNLQTLSTNSNYKFTLHYIHSQLDLIKDVVNNIKPNNMYRYFISVYTTLNATIYPILSYYKRESYHNMLCHFL